MFEIRGRRAACVAVLLGATPLCAAAQASDVRDTVMRGGRLAPVTITATRTTSAVSSVPIPVTVMDSADVAARQPNTIADLFRDQPGLDVTGVGTNQRRPSIRGLRGQRILLLEDGLRLNNSRRQQDFGELPALVDVNDVERVEVVRGPASVLYGTDAMGGAVNVITARVPSAAQGDVLRARLGFGYGSADGRRNPTAMVAQRSGRFAYRLSGSWRETDAYAAPAGRFGDIDLGSDTRVNDSGVRDNAWSAAMAFDLTRTQQLTARVESYRARDAGFGYVDPAALGGDETLVRIVYPNQDVLKTVLGYRALALGSWYADRVEVSAYSLRNERDLLFNIDISFGPNAPPGAGMTITSANHTDLATIGARAEAVKVLGSRQVLTYGVDVFRDRSENTDTSVTTTRGFGPPSTDVDGRPQVPNATFRSAGVFVQDQVQLHERLTVIGGVRYQDVKATTRETPGVAEPIVSSSDRTVVGTANALFRATERVSLIASVGRGFRSPNLVERFFDGFVPEGSGYQRRNPDLDPETSLNTDIGVRYADARVDAEAFVFRNEIRDGIRTDPTGEEVNGAPEFRSVNVDRLRYTGLDARVAVLVVPAVTVSGSYSRLRSRDVRNPDDPVGDSYSSKLVGEARVAPPAAPWWASYTVRHNGAQDDAQIGESPIGPVLPAFTVHSLRAGLRTATFGRITHGVTLGVENLTNALYAEFANAGFFRPEAERSVVVSYYIAF